MKKKESLVPQPEIKSILKKQTAVNVVLNNGSYQLDDATIPFQIGFDEKIAEKKPTHVLVIDITGDVFAADGERQYGDNVSPRTLFKLEPINYLQLNKAGEHHLVFILFSSWSKSLSNLLLNKRFSYEEVISFFQIEKNKLWYQAGYCEKVITVPKEFFADKPQTKFKKHIWYWVNSWHKLQPVDECEYRKRKISAFTIKPIIWLLGFMARFLIAVLVTSGQFIVRVLSTIFGYQPAEFFPHFKEVWWHFLCRYSQSPLKMDRVFDVVNYWFGETVSEQYFDGAEEIDFHEYKFNSILGIKFHSPLTIFGATFYALGIISYSVLIASTFSFKTVSFVGSIGGLSFLCIISLLISLMLTYNTLPTFFSGYQWKKKWDHFDLGYRNRHNRTFQKSIGILGGFALFAFVISALGRLMISLPASLEIKPPSIMSTLWILFYALVAVLSFYILTRLAAYIRSGVGKLKDKMRTAAKKNRETKTDKRLAWLKSSFKLENLPAKVDVNQSPEPSVFVHRFVIKFWQTKAKVCRPYAKD